MPYRSEQSALPETMTPDEVADRLGMKPDTVRRWIRADMADGGHRVPGGRCEGSRFVILRAVFERAVRQGIEPETHPTNVTPDALELAARLRQRAAEDLELADRLAELAVKTKGRR